MAFKILVFLLPALVFGQIKVNIEAGRTLEDSFVQAVGSTVDIISEPERETFQIQDWRLKNAVQKFSGGTPADVFVRGPTPWDDLYSRYNWDQVTRTLRPVSAKVLSLKKEPMIVKRDYFRNRSLKNKSKYTGTITQQRESTVSTTWSSSYGLTVGHSIEYSVGISEVLSAGGSTSISFSAAWGSSTSKSETVTLGSGLGVEVELHPGAKAMAVLSASLGTLEVEVEYEATLSGLVATNYNPTYKGHYFWGYDVNAVLRAAGLPTSKRSKEIIKVGFYSDESVTNYDLLE